MKTYKLFDYKTQRMDPELKKDWLDFMKVNPQLYMSGSFYDECTGSMCALGALIKVLGGDPAKLRNPLPDVYEDIVGRFDASFCFLGPKYERVYGLNDRIEAYPVDYIEANL